MKARGDGRGLGFPVPTLQDSLSRITSFLMRGERDQHWNRAQPACQITIATSMTHNAPHHSLEHTDEAGNPEVTTASPNDILPSPQTQQSCDNRQNTPLTGQKQNKVHCGYYNCVGKTDAYF